MVTVTVPAVPRILTCSRIWRLGSPPDDFLAYHQAILSPYRGMRGSVVETDEYQTAGVCARYILAKLQKL
ncbi:MAG: hypothetical protein DRP79_02800 [Planctomycetota bacterium]|nr:MAG: hypothetical protein DRP79_02800 [Planctomycetota bacterium]